MADEPESGSTAAAGGTADATAARLAMAASGEEAEDAREYLKKQTRLTDLQIENLQKLDAYETSHLRWRRFNDQMKGTLQVMLVAVGLVIVVAVAAAMWNASQAHGLVIGAFSMPPSLAQSGVDGDVVADDLTQKIGAIRAGVDAGSFSQTGDVRSRRSTEFKVQIPETGISLDEAWRALKSWLGQEREVSGHVRELGDGRIALTVALDGRDAMTFTGRQSELGELERKAAEHIFDLYDPNNYVVFLMSEGHLKEALAANERLLANAADKAARAGDADLEGDALYTAGALKPAIARERYSLFLAPNEPVSYFVIMIANDALGRTGQALAAARDVLRFGVKDYPDQFHRSAVVEIIRWARETKDMALGDFTAASSDACTDCSTADDILARAAIAARLHDVSRARAEIALAQESGQASAHTLSEARAHTAMAEGRWTDAAAQADAYARALVMDNARSPALAAIKARNLALPLRARAVAHAGSFAAAHAAIDETASDCLPCLTARGEIDALQKNWDGAEYWFARAAKQAPDVPFADADWGAMLLHEGKYDAAMAKFERAHAKGPHFADPLEMWGEALMQKNRADLALAKFAEAAKYAPNWGRLHLKWGEALLYTGEHVGAQKQFQIASHLDLAPSEKSELAQMEKLHD